MPNKSDAAPGDHNEHIDYGNRRKSKSCHNVALKFLLSSPYCWKPAKICSFILKSPDSIIYGREDDPLILKINSLAIQWGLWSVDSDWAGVLADDWKILQTYKGQPVKTGRREIGVNTRSVPELLRIIRNKYKHSNEFTIDQKARLGWFTSINKDSERDDALFAKYLTAKFPKLVPLLWEQFAKFRESLSEFYPSYLEGKYPNTCGGFLQFNFAELLEMALEDHLHQGNVEERYLIRMESAEQILEFRTLQVSYLSWLAGGSSTVEIQVSGDAINCKWYDATSQETLVSSEMETQFRKRGSAKSPLGPAHLAVKFVLFVTNESDESEDIFLEMLKLHRDHYSNFGRIIYFTNKCKDKVRLIARQISTHFEAKLEPKPVEWLEVLT